MNLDVWPENARVSKINRAHQIPHIIGPRTQLSGCVLAGSETPPRYSNAALIAVKSWNIITLLVDDERTHRRSEGPCKKMPSRC
jgi:hypothetical protein